MSAALATVPRTVTVANGRYVPGTRPPHARGKSAAGQCYDALHYMQTRELGENERPEDRRFFGAEREGGRWEAARAVIMDHATDRVAFHRLILSPGQEVADLREWTRMVMDELSDRLGQELHWVAVVHRNTAHAHAHVLLAGGGEREREGVLTPVVLRREHYGFLRQAGDRSAEHLRGVGRAQGAAIHAAVEREASRAERSLQAAHEAAHEAAQEQDRAARQREDTGVGRGDTAAINAPPRAAEKEARATPTPTPEPPVRPQGGVKGGHGRGRAGVTAAGRALRDLLREHGGGDTAEPDEGRGRTGRGGPER